jgi:Amt family ammonium transporter
VPRILVACLLSAAAGAAGWLVARLIGADRVRAADAVFGTLTGLVAALASCASVAPQWSLVIGVAAGSIGGLLAGRFARRNRSGIAFSAAMLLAGGVIGTFALGLFVDGSGLVHTGGVDQFVAQVQATAVAVCWSILVSLLLTLMLRPTRDRGDQRSVQQRVDQQRAAGLLARPAGSGATSATHAAERD